MNFMRKTLIITALLVLASLSAKAQFPDFFGFGLPQQAQQQESPRLSFLYDVNFEYLLDNREYDDSGGAYSSSMTINALRLSPGFGLGINASNGITHKLMMGIDIRKNMGENPTAEGSGDSWNWDMFQQISAWYQLGMKKGDTRLDAYFGIIPRRLLQGEYNRAFISDSLAFYRSNIEGPLLRITRPRAMYEIGIDWAGMIDEDRREQFHVFSYGKGLLAGNWLHAGWTFDLQHFANTTQYKGVVENIMAEPFLMADIGERLGLQQFSAKLSILAGMQQDRRLDSGWDVPLGGRLILSAMQWNIGLSNSLYVGTSLMPYYNDYDDGGYKYGSEFYWGDPFYRIHRYADKTDWDEIGVYDRIEAFWQPGIADGLKLRISMVGHFVGDSEWFGFAGWQQKISLIFDLGEALHPAAKAAPKARTPRKRQPNIVIDKNQQKYM